MSQDIVSQCLTLFFVRADELQVHMSPNQSQYLSGKTVSDSVKSFIQQFTRAGQVDADETFSRFTIHGTGIDMNIELVYQQLFDFMGGEAGLAAVTPDEVCAFEAGYTHPRQSGRENLAETAVVGEDVTVHFAEPLIRFRVCVCRDKGRYAERVHITYLIDVDGFVDCIAPVLTACDDVGDLQSGYVEGLARRAESDGVAAYFL